MHYNSISPAVKSRYVRKFVTPAEAVSVIQSGDRVYIHPGCAVPQVLVEAMVARYEELHDVDVCHLLGVGEAMAGLDPLEVYTTKAASRRGIGPSSPDEVEVVGTPPGLLGVRAR